MCNIFAENGDDLPISGLMKEIGQLQAATTMEAESDTDMIVKQSENIMFEDASIEEEIVMPTLMDDTYDEDKDERADLANYLSRPVNINTFTWTQSPMSTYAGSFRPWHSYISDSKVYRKVQNYCRFHGKLHLKFVMNASPFFYGAIRVVYEPRRQFLDHGTSTLELVPASQTPGVWLTPQDMSSAEMVLPFIHENNWIDPNSITALEDMGRISFYVYSQLASANGASGSSITISTYAWVDDPTLVAPTAKETLQAETKKVGKVSDLADKVSSITGKMSSIPFVGSYASTASVAAKAVGSLAAAFGFSNAPVVSDVNPVVPKAFHAFANCETSMPNDKLCVDPDNEITPDNSVTGTDSSDPLALANVLRESYIGQFAWSSAMAPETSLQTYAVSPRLNHRENVTQGSRSGYRFTFTPMSYCASMFRLWRGSIIYRFKIIKTKYHRGRIRVTWDPAVDITGNADTETTCFTKLVDLDNEDEFEFEVPFKALQPYLNTDAQPVSWNTGSYAAPLSLNGFLNIRVQNVLSGPQGSATISVLVFQRPGSDFQFAQPQELNLRLTPYQLQSSTVIDGKTDKSGDHFSDICVGEKIVSLRPLLHRTSFSLLQTFRHTGDKGHVWSTSIYPRTPLWYGVTPFGISGMKNPATNVNAYGNFAVCHPIAWVVSMFIGYRGSTILSANINGGSNEQGRRIEYAKIERYPGDVLVKPTELEARNQLGMAWNDAFGRSMEKYACEPYSGTSVQAIPSFQRGGTLTKEVTQSALTAVSPQYSPVRFRVYIPSDIGGSNGVASFDNFRLDVGYYNAITSDTEWASPYAEIFYAAGVDFQPVFFVCTPTLYDWGVFDLT